MSYSISASCTGCDICVRRCPVAAISGKKKARHVIDQALCLECGTCGRVCTASAVQDPFGIACRMLKKSDWPTPRFNHVICMSCRICIDACPVGCLGMSDPPDQDRPQGHPFMERDIACIGCGFCARECPVEAITMDTSNGSESS